jgi:hypothetical protein
LFIFISFNHCGCQYNPYFGIGKERFLFHNNFDNIDYFIEKRIFFSNIHEFLKMINSQLDIIFSKFKSIKCFPPFVINRKISLLQVRSYNTIPILLPLLARVSSHQSKVLPHHSHFMIHLDFISLNEIFKGLELSKFQVRHVHRFLRLHFFYRVSQQEVQVGYIMYLVVVFLDRHIRVLFPHYYSFVIFKYINNGHELFWS